jgi:heme/copper-type cytochrome/quinol oxidase subunit 4
MSEHQATNDRQSARSQRRENNRGLFIITVLAVLTILEFVVASVIDDSLGLILGLTPFAVAKAWLVLHYFMHMYKLWRGEEDHS